MTLYGGGSCIDDMKVIKKDKRKSYTLIVDPTIIEAEKKEGI